MLDPPGKSHRCYPCGTTYNSLKNNSTLDEGESFDDPNVKYVLWRMSGMCHSCAKDSSKYDVSEEEGNKLVKAASN